MIEDLKPLVSSLCKYAQKQLNFSHPPKLFFKKDRSNSEKMLGRTAHYDPNDESVTVFISLRHPKDILRSISHELVHHSQNLRGDLTPEKCGKMDRNYAQKNKHMRNMEKEAYLKGNMCFRDWEDTLKDKEKILFKLTETKFLKERKNMSNKITKSLLKNLITKVLNEAKIKKEGAFSPSHYCIHHGGVQHEGKTVTAEAIQHTAPDENGFISHYDMKLEDGTVLENVAAGDIMVTNASLAESGHGKRGSGHKPYKEKDEGEVVEEDNEDLEEAAKMPDHPDVDKDGNTDEPISKAQQDKKEDESDSSNDKDEDNSDEKEESDKDLSKVPPQLRNHVAGKTNEALIQTPEEENSLYESRFTSRNTRIFEKLLKEWTK